MKLIRYRNSTIFFLFGIAAVVLTCCRYNNTSDSEKTDFVLNQSSGSRAMENINYFADSGRGLFVLYMSMRKHLLTRFILQTYFRQYVTIAN